MISRVVPSGGWPFYSTEIVGTGFKEGARAVFGGIESPWTEILPNGKIRTLPVWHEPGPVDVVVINPDGSSATLTSGFTYKQATLALSRSEVSSAEMVVATYAGPDHPVGPLPDVLQLHALGDPANPPVWITAVGGTGSGELSFPAPSAPGRYELRYLMFSQLLLAQTAFAVR